MKKRIIFLISIIIVIAMFSGCKKKEQQINNNSVTNNDQEQVQEIQKPLNETYVIDESIVSIEDKLGQGTQTLSEAEVKQKYNFESFGNLEAKVVVNKTNESYEEVAVVKLTDESQEFKIQETLYNRYKALKDEYKDDAKITKSLEGTSVKIKIQDGVAVLIISDDADELMKLFDNEF